MIADLLAITDFDSAEFVDRCHGLWLTALTRSKRAGDLEEHTSKRVLGMRRHSFTDLAQIGEALLRVQDARPGEFHVWFQMHEERLGFSASTADRAKAAAMLVREHGLEAAFNVALARHQSPRPEPLLADTLRLTKNVEDMAHEERLKWIERLAPWVETYERLRALEPFIPSLPSLPTP